MGWQAPSGRPALWRHLKSSRKHDIVPKGGGKAYAASDSGNPNEPQFTKFASVPSKFQACSRTYVAMRRYLALRAPVRKYRMMAERAPKLARYRGGDTRHAVIVLLKTMSINEPIWSPEIWPDTSVCGKKRKKKKRDRGEKRRGLNYTISFEFLI